MIVDRPFQNENDFQQKAFRENLIKEGMDLWRKQREYARAKKFAEQKEMREMLQKYFPWGQAQDMKPRGLRNLRLEELFPNEDYQKAKRFVGTIDLERGGGGAPLFKSGKKITKTREDPLLRYQFGSKDLRRCVDNTLRYKTTREAQQEYKKQLDKLVEEKKLRERSEKAEMTRYHQEQGWSNEHTLKQLENEEAKHKSQNSKEYEKLQKIKIVPPNKIIKLEPLNHRKNFLPAGKNRKLSPLSEKDIGVELVTLLAKNRKHPLRFPLCSSDVTSEKKMGKITLWNRQGSSYLKELTQQMICKQKKLEEIKTKESETAQRHFNTWDDFWGRPGHGAPLPEIKKQHLDRLLYPQMYPISVH